MSSSTSSPGSLQRETSTSSASISSSTGGDSSGDVKLSKGDDNNKKGSITPRQWMILTVLMVATLTSSFAVCLFPPFYPEISEEKGFSGSVYGPIIGTNCLTSFIVTPFIGKHQRTIGVRFALISGMLAGGICCILSGLLEFFSPKWTFIVFSVLIRIVHATGNALVITATFTFTAIEFPNAIGKIFSLTRTAMNLAQLFGPSIGGAIYGAGGFYLPFVAMGAVQVLMSMISIYLLPECKCKTVRNGNEKDSEGKVSKKSKKEITVSNMLSIPLIWFSFMTFIVATACNGFLSINLEPKVLRAFELSPFQVGLLFGLKDGANCLGSPIWGYLTDKCRKATVKPFMALSAVLVAASFFLLGACDVFGIHLQQSPLEDSQLGQMCLVIAALSLNGFGIGGEQVSGVVDALHEAINAGYPDDPNMHGLIAGLWSSLSGAGRFVSRAGSGVLVTYIGFQKTAAIAFTLQMVVAVVTIYYALCFELRSKLQRAVKWSDVAVVANNQGVAFTEGNSPSEPVTGAKSIHVDIPTTPKSIPGRRGRRGSILITPAQYARSLEVEE